MTRVLISANNIFINFGFSANIMSEDYVNHPLLKEEAMESRAYQEVIAAEASEEDTLVVLPTGLGKTPLSVLVSAMRLNEFPDSKILMIAPTKPLAEQHADSYANFFDLPQSATQLLTGEVRPERRQELWNSEEKRLLFATPQTVANDLEAERLSFTDFSLLVVDECHRAVGDYAYVYIADRYHTEAEKGRILGLTASPGGDKAKIKEVADNLHVDNFQIRTEEDEDVQPWIKETELNWQRVELNKWVIRVKENLNRAFAQRKKKLKRYGIKEEVKSKKDLLKLRNNISQQLEEEEEPKLYGAISLVAALIKLQHALELIETQGVHPLYQFIQKLKADESKAASKLLADENVQEAIKLTEYLINEGKEHPKIKELVKILKRELQKRNLEQVEAVEGESKKNQRNAIVFTQYRDTVDLITRELNRNGLRSKKFKGQKGDFTQDKQKQILNQFRQGQFDVLVSTSVGEEGLDVPGVDLVVFYEPIPSEIRNIQRRGRTGRQKSGKVYVLIAEGTRDEAFYWSSYHRERKMKGILKGLQEPESEKDDAKGKGEEEAGDKQKSLDRFSNRLEDK